MAAPVETIGRPWPGGGILPCMRTILNKGAATPPPPACLTASPHGATVRLAKVLSLYPDKEIRLKGKPVRTPPRVPFRRCPAAVIGNDRRHRHWDMSREATASRWAGLCRSGGSRELFDPASGR